MGLYTVRVPVLTQMVPPTCKMLKSSVSMPIPSTSCIGLRPNRGRAFGENAMSLRHLPIFSAILSALLTACVSVPLDLGSPKAAEANMIAPLVEKRETLVATGYAVISVQNHKNSAQQRLLAIRASKLDAYRALTEQVYGQQLDTSTTVADMTVMSDTFRAKVEGVIYGAVVVSITPVGDDTYETTLSLDQQVVRDLRALYLSQLVARRR